jgi:hypothetical protein
MDIPYLLASNRLLLKIIGSKQTSVIFMGDIWKPGTLWDSRYFWMPVQIGNGELHLPSPHPWLLNVKAGGTTFE